MGIATLTGPNETGEAVRWRKRLPVRVLNSRWLRLSFVGRYSAECCVWNAAIGRIYGFVG